MGPAQAIKTCFAKSFQFSGRASRAEFWLFGLFCMIATRYVPQLEQLFWEYALPDQADIPLHILTKMQTLADLALALPLFLVAPLGFQPVSGSSISTVWMGNWTFLGWPYPYLGTILFLLLIIPTLSAAARRARDVGFNPVIVLLLWLWPMAIVLASNIVISIGMALQGGITGPLLTTFTQHFVGPFIAYVAPLPAQITALIAVCILALPSQPGPNSYGPNPLEATP